LKRIRVVHVVDKLVVAGTQRHILALSDGLRRHGIDSEILCLLSGGPLTHCAESLGVRVTVLGMERIYDVRACLSLPRAVGFFRCRRPDAVLVYLFAAHIYGTVAARLAGVRRVISCRRQSVFWHKKEHAVARRLANTLIARTIANSRSVARFVALKEGIPRSEIEVVPNGVDVARFGTPDASARGKWRLTAGADETTCVVGTVGSLKPVKGHDLFLEAAARVAGAVRNVRFLIIGEGPLKGELVAHAQRLGIADIVHFAGGVADVDRALSAMDIFVLASRSEGMSNALLEAMAAGLPVVAADVGGNPEVVADGVEGFLVPGRDADEFAAGITTLAGDPELRRSMGRGAAARTRRDFTDDRMCARMAEIIRETVGTTR